MPSPLAHGSVAWLTTPTAWRGLPLPRKAAMALLILCACVAPDLDILIDPMLGYRPFTHHGYWTHSLLLVPLFALLFAGVSRPIVPWPFTRLLMLGALCYGSHVVMDWLTPGRGVGLLWPLMEQRYASPVKLFVGVEHGNPEMWRKHLLTLLNEGLFALLCHALWRWRLRRAAAH